MGADEKTRVSGEVTREQDSPILPTVNPEAQKSEPAKAAIHPALYVVYVEPPLETPARITSLTVIWL